MRRWSTWHGWTWGRLREARDLMAFAEMNQDIACFRVSHGRIDYSAHDLASMLLDGYPARWLDRHRSRR